MSIGAILVAAGRGERFGGPKHGALLGGKPLWEWARHALEAGGLAEIVLVGAVPGGIAGGARRRDSVMAGLEALRPGIEFVVIHDAARPLAGADLVARVRDRLTAGHADGVVPVLPLRDTVKRVDREVVVETLERADLVAVQTPQGFRTETLRAAHAADDSDATDDAVLVERLGGVVVTVPGEIHNLKITFPEDLRLAEALLP